MATESRGDIKALMCKQRELQRSLRLLTRTVALILGEIDKVMQGPSTPARGKQIAALCNRLESENDSAMRFALGMSFKTINRLKGAPGKSPVKGKER